MGGKNETTKLSHALFHKDPFYNLLSIKDLQFASDLLNPIMFTDDTNFFYSNKDINTAFLKLSHEFKKVNEWFISNKLSFNMKKKNK